MTRTTPQAMLTEAEMTAIERKVRHHQDHGGPHFWLTRDEIYPLIAAARAHLSAGGWRPIETAPKDGTRVLLGASEPTADNDVEIGWWRKDYQGWYHDRYKLEDRTHWKSLTPPTPSWEEQKEGRCDECGATFGPDGSSYSCCEDHLCHPAPTLPGEGGATLRDIDHLLKVWPAFFPALRDGSKTFELRKIDRNFKVGDILQLEEWSPETKRFTGRSVIKRVTYMLQDAPGFGLKDGYCILALDDLQPSPKIQHPWYEATSNERSAPTDYDGLVERLRGDPDGNEAQHLLDEAAVALEDRQREVEREREYHSATSNTLIATNRRAAYLQAALAAAQENEKRLRKVLNHIEAVMSIVPLRSDAEEYLETLDEVRAALTSVRRLGIDVHAPSGEEQTRATHMVDLERAYPTLPGEGGEELVMSKSVQKRLAVTNPERLKELMQFHTPAQACDYEGLVERVKEIAIRDYTGPDFGDGMTTDGHTLIDAATALENMQRAVGRLKRDAKYYGQLYKEQHDIDATALATAQREAGENEKRLREANEQHLEALAYAESSLEDTSYHGTEYARSTALRYISAYLARAALGNKGGGE